MRERPSEMCSAKLNERGRVTIDVDVRRDLSLEHGDYVILTVEPVNGDNDE
jgi:bifunctional DNA-binding transcriptional regulator/antitoxin component of YhaV-PrlF toxin-antitoxin module